jgi:membrane-associated phospholipid phosphatase
MPIPLTVFAANRLIFVNLALAIATLAALLLPARKQIVRWVVAAVITLALSLALARVGGLRYDDPRPFVLENVTPLFAHAPDNRCPSDHALLAAAIVALVFLARPKASVPDHDDAHEQVHRFAVLAVLVDWAPVARGVHHAIDVIGSSAIVTLALVIACAIQVLVAARLHPGRVERPDIVRPTPALNAPRPHELAVPS